MAQYEVVHGIDWTTVDGEPRRAEPGELVDDLPESAIEHLVAQGSIGIPAPPEDAADDELEDYELDPDDALLEDAEPLTDDDAEGGE